MSPVFKKVACVGEVTASCVKEQGPCWFKCSALIAKALIFDKTCVFQFSLLCVVIVGACSRLLAKSWWSDFCEKALRSDKHSRDLCGRKTPAADTI